METVKKQHPELDIRFVFQKNNPLRKGSKLRYTDWAEKYGFPHSVNSIPEDWLI